jgi:hypothetical protein
MQQTALLCAKVGEGFEGEGDMNEMDLFWFR